MSDSGEPADQMSISAAELDQQEQQEQQQQPSTAEQTEADAQRTDEPTACLAPFVGQFESAAAALPITGTKRKRARKNTLNTSTVQPVLDAHPPHEAAATAADDEDINLHVDAGWSDDDKDDKDSSAKRAAAEGEDGAPAPAAKQKKQANPLDNFTVRAVVTRKDVDVVFEHSEGARERLEQDTGTRIVIVAGKDDPDIVVDRVLIINGQIDAVAAAYKVIAQGMLEIKRSKASASSTATDKATATTTAGVSAAGQKPESSDKHDMHVDDDEEEEDSDDEAEGDKHSGSAAAAVDAQNTAEAGSDADEHASPSAVDADNDSDNNESDDDEADDNTANGQHHPAKPAAAAAAADAQPSTETSKTEPPATTSEKKTRTNPSSSADSVTLRMLVPQKCVGSIMGHGGKSINRIREEASVSIHTSEGTLPRSSERIVAVIGAPAAIQKAITLMASALTRDMAAYNNADFYVPAANLPSAMTVETNHRKRKDGKRQGQGYADHYPNNRGYGNRNSGFRHGGGNSHGGGYRNSNYNSGGGGGNRNHGHSSAANSGYGRNAMHGNNRNDRYARNGNDRQSNRGRAPGAISHVNRMPVGASSNTQSYHGNNNNSNSGNYGNYRSGGHNAGNRSMPPQNTANYGGYPAPSPTFYSSYRSHASGPSNMSGGGGSSSNSNTGGAMAGLPYGTNMSPVSPGQNPGVYGGAYNAAPAPYQFASPVGYAYPAAPVQGMYPAPAQPSQSYPSRGGRPMISQGQYSHPQQQQQPPQQPQRYDGQYQRQPMISPSVGMGAVPPPGPSAGGFAAGAADQTIQKIYVSADKVGAVIGRRGETINDIRQTTNARVDIQDPAHGSKERLIIITGGYDQVHSAFNMIKNKIDTIRPSGMRP